DVDGRITSRVDLLTSGQSLTAVTTRYAYAPFDLLSKVTNNLGHVTTFTYDVRGRRTQLNAPDRGLTTTTYYPTRAAHTHTQAATGTATFGYADLGRKTSSVSSDGTTTFGYDSAVNGIGALAYAISPDQIRTDYRYDSFGRRTGLDYTDQTDGAVYKT